jgi:hypothetical protein
MLTVVSNHVNSDHVPSFSCLDVWTNWQATSGVYAITVTTSAYHSRRCGRLIWNRHSHECLRIWKLSGNFTLIQCIKKCQDFLGRDILGTTFFLGPNLVSFNRVVVPYEISKVNFHVETKILVSMSEEI